jgi:hypothetical protein
MRRRPTQSIRRETTRVSCALGRSGSRTTEGAVTLKWIPILALGLMLFMPTALASAAPLEITYAVDGIPGASGWYRGSSGGNYIVLHWHVSDPMAITDGCEPGLRIPGPTTGFTSTCTAQLGDETVTKSLRVRIDRDPPTGVAASLPRGPDFNGWYNHPLGVSWHGSDATSGIASCSAVTYSGPDRASAPIGGGCTDRAGNTASAPVSINYDATAPLLSKVSITSRAGSDLVHWKSSSPVDTAVVERRARGAKQRPVVYRGSGTTFTDKRIRSDLEYTYSVQTIDQAGNASAKVSVAGLPKVLTLRKLPYVPRVAPKPILRWAQKRGAAYYHVQLFRGSKRIFASWPLKHHLGLPGVWRWSGHRYRLAPGRYRWYVWEGLGPRSFARYRTIGSAQFIVPKR